MDSYGKVSLNIYSIRINKVGDRKVNYVLSDYDDGHDIYSFFKDCMENWVYIKTKEDEDLMKDEINQKVIRIKRRPNDDKPYMEYFGRSFSGLYESGEYGIEQDVIDTRTGKRKYKQDEGDAPLLPFYFLFDIGKDNTTGFLILQRFKQFGVYGLCKNIFSHEFKQKHPDYNLAIERFSSIELVKHAFAESEMKGLVLTEVNYGEINNSTVARSIGVQPHDSRLKLSLESKRGRAFPYLTRNKFLEGSKFVSVDGLEYAATEFIMKIGGTIRKFTRNQIDEYGYSCEITDKIKWDKSKNPTYESINKEAKALLKDIYTELKNRK